MSNALPVIHNTHKILAAALADSETDAALVKSRLHDTKSDSNNEKALSPIAQEALKNSLLDKNSPAFAAMDITNPAMSHLPKDNEEDVQMNYTDPVTGQKWGVATLPSGLRFPITSGGYLNAHGNKRALDDDTYTMTGFQAASSAKIKKEMTDDANTFFDADLRNSKGIDDNLRTHPAKHWTLGCVGVLAGALAYKNELEKIQIARGAKIVDGYLQGGNMPMHVHTGPISEVASKSPVWDSTHGEF